MKILSVILLVILSTSVYGQYNGFYVTLKGDTVNAFINLRKDVFGPYSLLQLYKEVRISSDSISKEIIFRPGDIAAFRVNSSTGDHIFYSKPVKENELRFMQIKRTAPSATLYSLEDQRFSNTMGSTTSVYYTIERSDGSFLYIFSRNNVKIKKELKVFFAADQKVMDAISTLFKQPGYVDRDLLLLFERIK